VTTRLARGTLLATWVGSVVVFALTLGLAVFLLLFWLFGKWENPSARLDAVLEIVGPCIILIAAWVAIREWRRRGGRIPPRLWWLVLGLGPGAIVAIAAITLLMYR